MRTRIATWTAKIAAWAIRVSGRGQGSTLPGRLALAIDRDLIKRLVRNVPVRIIISGTNGKTTTTRLITRILRTAGKTVVANEASANLASGVASSLALAARGAALKADIVVLEVDEHVVPGLVDHVQPTALCFTNLFRDQLDRYGEVQSVANRWQRAIAHLSPTATLIVNANDPHLVHIARSHTGPTSFFGVPIADQFGVANRSAADAVRCPICTGELTGERYMAHLGVLRCAQCTFATPPPDVSVTRYRPAAHLRGSLIDLERSGVTLTLKTTLLGRYNALNIAAAVLLAKVHGVQDAAITKAVAELPRIFGRSEYLVIKGHDVLLHLAKNPTGYNEVISTVLDVDAQPSLLLALNDNWADGQDVSWIWDVDFERIAPHAKQLTVSGQRAGDLAVRLDVAGSPREITVTPDLRTAFDVATEQARGRLHIIASYTAMLQLRRELVARKLVKATWHD